MQCLNREKNLEIESKQDFSEDCVQTGFGDEYFKDSALKSHPCGINLNLKGCTSIEYELLMIWLFYLGNKAIKLHI